MSPRPGPAVYRQLVAGTGDTGRGREQVLETVRAVVMQAPVPMAFYEAPDLRIAIANDRYLDVVGRRDIVGRPLADAVPELAERGPDSLAILLESGRGHSKRVARAARVAAGDRGRGGRCRSVA